MAETDRSKTPLVIFALAIVTVVGFAIATRPDEPAEPSGDPVARGKRLYELTCVACHHRDPTKELSTTGTYGPPIAHSSLELLRMRLRTTSYPEGYEPKRKTSVMPTFELLTDRDIGDLHRYLGEPGAWK